jgi:hypothetical protein
MTPPDSTQSPSPAPTSTGVTALGRDHPLARATDTLRIAVRQWCVVAAMVIGAGIASLEGHTWGLPLTLAAGATLLLVSTIVIAAHGRRRDRAIDLILDGHDSLPIGVVQHERRRLESTRTRAALARRFEDIVELSAHPHLARTWASRPLYHLRVVVRATPELIEIVRLLRTRPVSIRGVASAERVIAHAESPLYGFDHRALRSELARVADLLDACEASRPR